MITKRDKKVIDFLEQFKIANTSTIHELFYPSLRVAQNRLKTLTDHKAIKRTRNHINMEYLYYIKKPRQIKHRLLLTDFHRELNKMVKIIDFQNEFIIEHLRADGFVAYKYNNKGYIAFIEVEISNKSLDINKYKKLFKEGKYKLYFPVFPKLIVITNKKISEIKEFEVIQIKEDFSNFQAAMTKL